MGKRRRSRRAPRPSEADVKNPVPENAVIGGVRIDPYGFSDYERRAPMLWLALGFAALVVITGRWRGARALAGLAASIAIIAARRHGDRCARSARRPHGEPGVDGDGAPPREPGTSIGRLVREAMSVGHDHIAATVNTLVLAYAGASLPVLLIFGVGDTPFADAVNTEAVAEQIVGTLVGSVGLIAAVPVTTVLATALARDLPERVLADAHTHAH